MRLLASPEGKKEYVDTVQKPYLSIPGLFSMFKSLDVPFDVFAEVAPKMQPRYYTISSSSKAQPERVSITMSVLKGGVCTNYLAQLRPTKGDRAPIFVRPSTFRLPKQISTPIIMIGPGTGLAPFKGFLQEFRHNWEQNGNKKPTGEGARLLYFGCRRSDQDFIYKDELTSAAKEGVLTGLHTAFSREGKQKVYVQHLMANNAKQLWELLELGGHVYVCGATAMGRDVKDTFIKVVSNEGGRSVKDAQEYMEMLQSGGRYVQELWST